MITQNNLIIDGVDCWQLAQKQRRTTLLCQVCEVGGEQEALYRFLELVNRPIWLNGFSRVLLALELESWLRECASANQIAGGHGKALSKMSEAEKHNCRKELSELSGVSEGNVDKVRKISAKASPQLFDAVRSGEVSIHRAWKLCELSHKEQQATLASSRSKKRSQRRLRELKQTFNNDGREFAAGWIELRQVITKMRPDARSGPVLEQIERLVNAIDAADRGLGRSRR